MIFLGMRWAGGPAVHQAVGKERYISLCIKHQIMESHRALGRQMGRCSLVYCSFCNDDNQNFID